MDSETTMPNQRVRVASGEPGGRLRLIPVVLGVAVLAAGVGACRREPSAEIKNQLGAADPAARREALRTLGRQATAGQIAPSAAVPALVDKLADADPSVRAVAAACLGALPGSEAAALQPLAQALGDPSPLVRMNAARALGLYGEKASPVASRLLDALDDTDADTRRAAASALAYHPALHYSPPAEYSSLSPADAAARVRAMGSSADLKGLFRAAQEGDIALVTLLLRAGLDPNLREEATQRTAIMLAGSHPDVLRVLLAGGADVNALAPSGTALFSAVIAANPHSVKVLLDAGADTRLQKNTGEIALNYAMSGTSPRHEEIRRLLRTAGSTH